MQRTVRIRLQPDAPTAALFAATVASYTSSFNVVARTGWEAGITNGVALHQATYYPERTRTGLPAQLVCAARVKATEALKSAAALTAKELQKPEDKRHLPTMPRSDHCPIRYDARSYRVDLAAGTAALLTTDGRRAVTFALSPYHRRYADWRTASADLFRDKRGRWWLHVVVVTPAPVVESDAESAAEVVGVDLGIIHPATDSRGHRYGADHWQVVEQRTHNLRRRLQAKGTKSAMRHLKKLSGRQQRFRRDCDHVLSKRLVTSVQPGATLVFEDLTDIGRRVKARKPRRRRLHSWSFDQVRGFTEYKAEARGVGLAYVDPRHTSQRCSACGHRERANRPSRAVFRCVACGFACDADHNAASNIRHDHLTPRAAVSPPTVSDAGTVPVAPGTSPCL
jgi:putative transposase